MAGAGYRDWSAGEIPTAAQFDTFLQEQTVMVFATAAARDTALSTAKSEGMVTYQLDTNTLTVYSGAAWSTIGPVHGAWPVWTPTVTQSGSVTHTATYASYTRSGRHVTASFRLAITGTGTTANAITVTLPVAIDNTKSNIIGMGMVVDATGNNYSALIQTAGTSTMRFVWVTSNAGDIVGTGSAAFALANGDSISGTVTYEASGDA